MGEPVRYVWDGEKKRLPGVPKQFDCYRHKDGWAIYDPKRDKHVWLDHGKVSREARYAALCNLGYEHKRRHA